ncbi:ABC transporter substrate-binding protein [Mameliella sediminis]|uniref:ABC transporter substrate-binding protein n=1 Tax=Mameliella sediminis TaxID=2836866 RepID=UPI001C48CB74|nr:ABC transporter substrate-binding protein [Mameliella sediminis]MBV7396574.1 ABC transporter substrate-binding protein [Mameliella sediminis]MBY6162863.1 ABC transporter substrate-binding protein [Mameliella alba]MBY6171127.1 ABC transporter substrate-binding protein [Mameliella alba]MBY6176351.1 ABC transporter substrate-binding protein [Mameliella alba]
MLGLKTALGAICGVVLAGAAWANDKVVLGTNWLAQGGHGGFYQALVDGTYEKYGLEVEIRPGGPQVNNRPMLSAGRLDFLMAGNLLLSFDNVRNGIPTTVVAAFFQKDPQALMAHSGAYADFAALAEASTVLISKDGQFSFWQWLVDAHGFRDEQLRPYGFNLAQFLNDEALVQQAYGTAEPIYAANQGADVDTFLLADQGWSTYATTIETRQKLIDENPDLVQRFLNASIEGWYNFLYGDRSAAYGAIIAANPEMTVEKLDKEMAQFDKLGIIDVGDATTLGIGALTDERIRAFHELAVSSGIIEDGAVDLSKVADTRFVNKGHGLDIRATLTGN